MLAVRTYGDGPPVVALHGFTHTGAQFADVARLRHGTLIAPDLPGHGATTIHPVDFDTTLSALGRLLEGIGPVPVTGYSQGGRIALWLAMERGELVTSLTLISASPGAEDGPSRRAADEELAVRIEHDGIGPFLDEWLASPPTDTGHLPPRVRDADRALRMENTAAGLAAALRGLGQGARPSLMSRLGELAMPATFLAGERDRRYVAFATGMADAVASGRVVVVEGAGHNVVLDAPQAVAAELDRQPV